MNILALLSMRLREFTVQVENLSLKEIPGRLASYLLYLAQEQGNKHFVKLNISKLQLSNILGTVPESLSRALSNMKAKKLIEEEDAGSDCSTEPSWKIWPKEGRPQINRTAREDPLVEKSLPALMRIEK
jgi:hypothetical protein